ncbi:hypothetical protein [Pseudonocardia hydrocarbonoxydans]|uniref:Uncharacterized protein n=1 Tax=Pseudonocardia hydrocarbonoxydans TaxID=76726 RepID=A0A4Y3WTF3_9PSEU|nr:hypothetical protein [Pseudonocardia hydrocarbonoxydans]GEC22162.1 hypothetical protein PHY01_44450 [Pseudonocardia hydrocarbonoxydans]
MQPALTPEILIPAGIGALLLLVAVVVVRRLRRRRARARMRPTVADAVRDAGPVGPEPGPAVPEDPAVPAGPVDGPPDRGEGSSEHGVDPADRVGSGRTVAAAVAHAFAVREARGRPAVDGAPATAHAHLVGEGDAAGAWSAPGGPPADRGDARDRLLAVLLDDPVRAVGATVELEACRRQLARLTEAVQHERDALGSVLARLADAGLAPDQLARLSGLSDDELRGLLAARVGAG